MKMAARLLLGIGVAALLVSAILLATNQASMARNDLLEPSPMSSDVKATWEKRINPVEMEVVKQMASPSQSHNVAKDGVISSSLLEKETRDEPPASSIPINVMDRFKWRNKLAEKGCRKYELSHLKAIIGKRNPMNRLFANKKLDWCVIYKSGSSYTHLIKARFPSDKNQKKRTDDRKRFVIVREPYSRMMSGYIDKLVAEKSFKVEEIGGIIKRFRPNATANEISCAVDTTFPEFIKYFIYSRKSGWFQNYHFVPITTYCDPCKKPFDFIMHLDTYEEDMRTIIESVNMIAVFPEPEDTGDMKRKLRNTLEQMSTWKDCLTRHDHLKRLWWVFQTRGFISRDIVYALTEKQSETTSLENLTNLFLDAHMNSIGRIDKYQQKRQYMVELFLQIPLEQRIKVRDILYKDFLVFGYDPQPNDLFPELAKRKA